MERIQRIHTAMMLALLLSLAFLKPANAQTVVLDPGHGGSDTGASHQDVNESYFEKKITLEVAKKTAAILKRRGVNVILTRVDDRDLSLPLRTKIANQIKADLFLSLHTNSHESSEDRNPSGIETYFLNQTTDESTKRISILENKGISVVQGSNIREKKTPLAVSMILKDLSLESTQPESKRLACTIQKNLVRSMGKKTDRGVRQSLFHVLLGADMPSALVELGFITHSEDRKNLSTPHGQMALSGALAVGIEQFFIQKNTELAKNTMQDCNASSILKTASRNH